MLNDPFDPYGWLNALTVLRVQFTGCILRLIRELMVEGAEGLTFRSFCADR